MAGVCRSARKSECVRRVRMRQVRRGDACRRRPHRRRPGTPPGRCQFPQWADLPVTRWRSSAPTTGSTGSVTSCSSGCRGSAGRSTRRRATGAGCRCWRPTCRWPARAGRAGRAGRGLPVPVVGRALASRREPDGRQRRPGPGGRADLAEFVVALQGSTPPAGRRKTGTSRGAPLENLADTVDEHLPILDGEIDGRPRPAGVRARRSTPGRGRATASGCTATSRPATCCVRDRRLTAVIDFGCLGVGDPAPDYAPGLVAVHRRVPPDLPRARPASTTPPGRAPARGR